MPHQFNSSYQIISTTFNHIVKCINGIERIVAFYKDEDDYSIKGIGLRQQGLQMTEEVINIETSDNNQIQSFIEDCKSYKWLDKQLIPFEEKHNNSLQLNIFDEYKHLILAISLRIHNQAKGIILVYFRDDARHFGIHHSSESLSTQQKPIIAQMLWNSVSSIITETVEQNEKFALFAQNAHQIIQQHQFTNQDVESDEKRSVFILSWAGRSII